MLYFLLVLATGIGIGCSISASETTKQSDDILRTEFLREFYTYTIGWRYDRRIGYHDFSLKLFRPPTAPPDIKVSWFGF
jgi:hypothetical protein